MDRAPAVVVPPAQQPVIEAQVISSSSQVQQVGTAGSDNMSMKGYMAGYKSAPQRSFPVYDMRGERRPQWEHQGSRVDLYA
jgi:hypothetical protein